MNATNYSIIIPHHNIPQLLQRCLDSIPIRDDIQIIIVDDNSSPKIVDFKNFPGINRPHTEIYFTKEGKGAGYARNIGLSHATGKWIIFADADDFFTNNFIDLIDKYVNTNYEIIYFLINSVYSDTLIEANRAESLNIALNIAIETNDYNELRYVRYSPWARMTSANLIKKHNILFEERVAANDIWFAIQTGYYAKDVYADNSTPFYTLTIRQGSLEMTKSKVNIDSRFEAAAKVNTFLFEHRLSKYHINLWPFSFFYIKTNIRLFLNILKRIVFEYYNSSLPVMFQDLFATIRQVYIKLIRTRS